MAGIAAVLVAVFCCGLLIQWSSYLSTILIFRAAAPVFLGLVALLVRIMDPEWRVCSLMRDDFPVNAAMKNVVYFVTLLALIFGFVNDLRVTSHWNKAVNLLRAYAAERKDQTCFEIPRTFYEKNLAGEGIADFCLSQLWALLQPGGVVDQFIWVNPRVDEGRSGLDPCRHLHDLPFSIITPFRGSFFRLDGKGFDYRFLRPRH